jgi:hypothetical protein
MAAKIRVLKGSRSIEFPENITKRDLVSILLKWAPKIANDDDSTPYNISGSDPCIEYGLNNIDDLLKDLT